MKLSFNCVSLYKEFSDRLKCDHNLENAIKPLCKLVEGDFFSGKQNTVFLHSIVNKSLDKDNSTSYFFENPLYIK